MHITVGALYLRDLELLSIGQLATVYSMQGLSLTEHRLNMATINKTMGNSLVTTNQYGILHPCSPWHSEF